MGRVLYVGLPKLCGDDKLQPLRPLSLLHPLHLGHMSWDVRDTLPDFIYIDGSEGCTCKTSSSMFCTALGLPTNVNFLCIIQYNII